MIEKQLLEFFKKSIENADVSEEVYIKNTKKNKKIFYRKWLKVLLKRKERYLQKNRELLSLKEIRKIEKEIKEEKERIKQAERNKIFLCNKFKRILNSEKDLRIVFLFWPNSKDFMTISVILPQNIEFNYTFFWTSDGYGTEKRTIIRKNKEWYLEEMGAKIYLTKIAKIC